MERKSNKEREPYRTIPNKIPINNLHINIQTKVYFLKLWAYEMAPPKKVGPNIKLHKR
jgi:hypothetical protein